MLKVLLFGGWDKNKLLFIFKFIHMNANVKGMLWTASAVVVGILVAGLIKDKLMPTSTAE